MIPKWRAFWSSEWMIVFLDQDDRDLFLHLVYQMPRIAGQNDPKRESIIISRVKWSKAQNDLQQNEPFFYCEFVDTPSFTEPHFWEWGHVSIMWGCNANPFFKDSLRTNCILWRYKLPTVYNVLLHRLLILKPKKIYLSTILGNDTKAIRAQSGPFEYFNFF